MTIIYLILFAVLLEQSIVSWDAALIAGAVLVAEISISGAIGKGRK